MTELIRGLGWRKDKKDERDYLYAVPPRIMAVLPSIVDLRPICPPVYDQGTLGSCTSQGIMLGIEFCRRRQGAEAFTLSRLQNYYNEREMEGHIMEDVGAMPRSGLKSAQKQGACPETLWPYDVAKFAVKPPQECYQEALKYQILSYHRIIGLNQIKGCLAEGYPVLFGARIYGNFPQETATGAIPMPDIKAGRLGGHFMVLVGYNDPHRIAIVRNSWGTHWGADGYGTIPYDYLTALRFASDFWTVRLVE